MGVQRAWGWPGFTHLPINHHISCSLSSPLSRPPSNQPLAGTTASGSGPAETPAQLRAAHGPWALYIYMVNESSCLAGPG